MNLNALRIIKLTVYSKRTPFGNTNKWIGKKPLYVSLSK